MGIIFTQNQGKSCLSYQKCSRTGGKTQSYLIFPQVATYRSEIEVTEGVRNKEMKSYPLVSVTSQWTTAGDIRLSTAQAIQGIMVRHLPFFLTHSPSGLLSFPRASAASSDSEINHAGNIIHVKQSTPDKHGHGYAKLTVIFSPFIMEVTFLIQERRKQQAKDKCLEGKVEGGRLL